MASTFSSRFFATCVAIALVLASSFAAIAVVCALLYQKDAEDRIDKAVRSTSGYLQEQLSQIFVRGVSVSRAMSHDGFLIRFLSDEENYERPDFGETITEYLQGCRETYEFDAAFLSLTKTRVLYSHKGFDRVLSYDAGSAWFNAAMANPMDYELNVDTDKFSKNEISIFVNCKIYGKDGQLLGIVGVCVHADSLMEILCRFEEENDVRASLISMDGVVELSARKQGFERQNWFSEHGNGKFRKYVPAAKLDGYVASEHDFAKNRHVVMRCLPETGWLLVTEHNVRLLVEIVRDGATSITGLFILAFFFSTFFISRLVRSFERDIVALSEERQKLMTQTHNAMLLTLADMVESRDANTGQHIRKTRLYVQVILKSMQRRGDCSDIITDEYIENVSRFAPLHDFGKINVPDSILNKPGKLTDEEFAVMKSHAARGGEMIQRIINLAPDSAYLEEARELARHHHEKWDGTGYPDGLSGEDIPLSARAMAVADVFDALVSDRPYKKAFPLEKAFSIIKEGRGRHFDPVVVDAFFAAKDEIISIEKSCAEEVEPDHALLAEVGQKQEK